MTGRSSNTKSFNCIHHLHGLDQPKCSFSTDGSISQQDCTSLSFSADSQVRVVHISKVNMQTNTEDILILDNSLVLKNIGLA